MARPVPRNIDKPNRNAEFAAAFLTVYYGLMFMTHEALLAFTMASLSVYFIHKVTIDKPEGQAFRLFYKYVKFGRLIPSPTYVKRFEV
jgi:hypothetical protein